MQVPGSSGSGEGGGSEKQNQVKGPTPAPPGLGRVGVETKPGVLRRPNLDSGL